MSATTTPQKVKRGPNGETRKRSGDLNRWEFTEAKELIISTARGFFCAIPYLDGNGSLECCSADTEFIDEEKLRDHIRAHHVGRKKEAIKLTVEDERPENAAVNKNWAFLTPTYHPYFRSHSRQSSITPSVGRAESCETSVSVDYSMRSLGNGRMTAMAPYREAAMNTIGHPAPAPDLSAQASRRSMSCVQDNTLLGPPSYNPRATPEQLSAEFLARLQQAKQVIPQELYESIYESIQKHFQDLPTDPQLDPHFSALFNNAQITTNLKPSADTSQAATPSFTSCINTLKAPLNNVQTKSTLDPSLITLHPQSGSAVIFGTLKVSPYTSPPLIETQVEPPAPEPLLHFQNPEYAMSTHHDLRQGQAQEFLMQVEQNSPFRNPFPAAFFHPNGWVASAMKRRERLGCERRKGHGMVVATSAAHEESANQDKFKEGKGKEAMSKSCPEAGLKKGGV